MCKGCGIIKAKAVKPYSRNPRSSMTVYKAKTRRRPPATTALVFLLKEYWSPDWSPNQGGGGGGCRRQNLYRKKAIDYK